MGIQLTLFDADDREEVLLPLRAAQHFGFSLQHHGEMYAVQDWIMGLTSYKTSSALSELIRRIKSEFTQNVTSEKLPYRATDGKTYKRDFVDSRGLYQIVAYLQSKDDRPILKELKVFLADAGVFGTE